MASLGGDGQVAIWSTHGDGFRVVSSGLKRSRLGTLKVHDLLCLSYTSAQPLLKTGRWGGRKGGKCSRRRQRPRPRPGGEGERRPGKQGLGVDEEQGVASQWGACSGCRGPDQRTVCSVPPSGVSGTWRRAPGQRQRRSASCVWDKQRQRPGLGVLKLPEHPPAAGSAGHLAN